MNKLICRLFLMVAFVGILSSCREDAEIPNHGKAINPEKEVAGTYVGTWTKTMKDNPADCVEAPGSIVLSATDEAYIGTVEVVCDDTSMNFSSFAGTTSRCNVIYQTGQYSFHNPLATNGLGTIFTGTVSFSGEATMTFQQTIKVGRVTYTYVYTFNGTKQ